MSQILRVYPYSFSRCCLPSREITRNSDQIWLYCSRSSKVIGVNRNLICDFLLVINSNFGRIWILTFKASKWLIFLTSPLFEAPARENPLQFPDETYPAKTRGMRLPYGESFIILTSTIFVWSTRVTNGQTGGWVIAYSVLSIYAICCRALKTKKITKTNTAFKIKIKTINSLCTSLFLTVRHCLVWHFPVTQLAVKIDQIIGCIDCTSWIGMGLRTHILHIHYDCLVLMDHPAPAKFCTL